MEDWLSGLKRRFAKPLSHVSGSVSSNLTSSVGGAYLEYTGQIWGLYNHRPIRDANTHIEPGGNRRYNPSHQAKENCPSGLWCDLGKIVGVKPQRFKSSILRHPLKPGVNVGSSSGRTARSERANLGSNPNLTIFPFGKFG